jgi:hypothetical protein
MAKRTKMSESELASLLDSQISDAVSYDKAERASLRDLCLEYRDGDMATILPAPKGRSSVISRDVQDLIGWVKPGAMRVFCSSDRVADYQPRRPDQAEYAKDATETVNYIFLEECQGYKVLYDAIDDGLAFGNGVIKHWWDNSPCYETQTFHGLSDDAFTALVSDDNVEVLEHTAHNDPQATFAAAAPVNAPPAHLGVPAGPDGAMEPMDPSMGMAGGPAGPEAGAFGLGGNLPSPQIHDVKIKRTIPTGRLRIKALPPENFLIPRDETELSEEGGGYGDWDIVTRSELIKRGFKKEDVDDLPEYMGEDEGTTKDKRDSLRTFDSGAEKDRSMEKVKVFEWYPLIDHDGTGVAERWQIIIGDMPSGSSEEGRRKILRKDKWGDKLPYTDLVPDPMPHRWRGRSAFDEANDIQRIKSVLTRGALDNLYAHNMPEREVVENSHNNLDVLGRQDFGQVHFVKQPGTITWQVVPFVADKAFGAIDYFDSVLEQRTGISRASMGLDPDILQNTTATASTIQQAARNSKIELYCRNMAKNGMRRLFQCLLALLTKHQDGPKMIRLRGKPVEMNPSQWDPDMDVSVNVGLGTGNRETEMGLLQGITQKQEQILLQLGPGNPLTGFEEYRYALAKMVEIGGAQNPELFFKEVTPEAMQAFAEQMAQQKDPKTQELEMKAQMDQQKAQMDAQFKTQELQQKAEIEKLQAQADIQTQLTKVQAELQMAREKHALERDKMMMEMQFLREKHQADLAFKQQDQAITIQAKQQQHAIDIEARKHDQHMSEREHQMGLHYGAKQGEQKLDHAEKAAKLKAKAATSKDA